MGFMKPKVTMPEQAPEPEVAPTAITKDVNDGKGIAVAQKRRRMTINDTVGNPNNVWQGNTPFRKTLG